VTDDARLADIVERIERILRATRGGAEEFQASEMIQDAVIRNLEVIGEAAKAITPRTRGRLPEVPWRDMARFRDLAIHQNGRILADEVWAIVIRDLPRIRRAISRTPPARRSRSRKPG